MSDFGFWGTVMDAKNVKSLAQFWCDATDYKVTESYYPHMAVLNSDEPNYPRFMILKTPDTKSAKNRMHMEFRTDDLKAESKRIVDLGGTIAAERKFRDFKWIVMQDPEGNEFCLVNHPKP